MSVPVPRTRRHARGLTTALAGLLALSCLGRPAPAACAPRGQSPLARIDSLWTAGARDSSDTLLDRALGAARDAGDGPALAPLLVRYGAHSLARGQARRAEPVLREAVSLAEAARDSATLTAAVRWLSVAVGSLGRMPEARDLYQRLLELAVTTRDRRHEGWARVGMAWDAWLQGSAEEALQGYRRAADLFGAAGEAEGEIWAQNGLGNALSRHGDYSEARAAYARAAELARAAGNRVVEGMALNNLGSLEYSLGDPGVAEARFARALALAREQGQAREAVTPTVNLAICRADLGRLDEATALLDSCLASVRAGGYRDLEAMVLCETAALSERAGRPREAIRRYRETLGVGDAATFEVRVRALVGLSAALADADSGAVALALLESRESWLLGREPDDLEVKLRLALGRRLADAGQIESARSRFRSAARLSAALGLATPRVEALAGAARCERALGRPDSALALLQEGVRVWEHDRGLPLDPEWRELRSAAARDLFWQVADLRLGPGAVVDDPARVREAFDILQAYKARTLLERMAGPGAAAARAAPPSVTLVGLQADVLAPGELLLDLVTGHEGSLVFAVTRDAARAARLPGDAEVAGRVRLYHGLLARPPGPGRALASSLAARDPGEALARELFAGNADLIAGARSVVVCPDGAFNLLPFSELPLDGEPLVARREVTRAPSATVFARARERSANGAGGVSSLLALAGGRDRAGRELAGARREARELGRLYGGVSVRLPDDDEPPVAVADLAAAGLLHVAGHMQPDDQHPWRSRLELAEGVGLAAAEVAPLALRARLVFLSSCGTATGRIVSGEGVLGMTAAFLAADAPAVVSTLWPVDDEATVALTRRFYAALAAGETAAAALRQAQLTLRDDPVTAAPFFWAGFVLAGDGQVRAPLETRRAWWAWWAWAAVGLAVTAAACGWLRRRRATEPLR